jgi:hypothetical protein
LPVSASGFRSDSCCWPELDMQRKIETPPRWFNVKPGSTRVILEINFRLEWSPK